MNKKRHNIMKVVSFLGAFLISIHLLNGSMSVAQVKGLTSLESVHPPGNLTPLTTISSLDGKEIFIHNESEEEQDESAKAYQKAYGLVLDEKWSEAISSMAAFLKTFRKSSYYDDALYWQCYAKRNRVSLPKNPLTVIRVS